MLETEALPKTLHQVVRQRGSEAWLGGCSLSVVVERSEQRQDIKHTTNTSVFPASLQLFFCLCWFGVRFWFMLGGLFSAILSFRLKLEAALHLIPITLSHFKPLFICRMLGPAVAANLHQIVTFTMLANSLFPFLLCSQCHRLLAITLFLENCNSPKRLSCLASWTTLQTTTASSSSTSPALSGNAPACWLSTVHFSQLWNAACPLTYSIATMTFSTEELGWS